MSIYIHIPFCLSICSYCDFCKMHYNRELGSKYLEALKKEVINNYKGEVINTLYIGGGTPSCLNLEQLTQLFNIIQLFNLSKNCEFTFEVNPDSLEKKKIDFLYRNKVNRLSIGIESFDKNNLKFLNRICDYNEIKEKINYCKKIGLRNINVDLIYAIPNQSLAKFKNDLELILSLNVTHISTYSLIIEPNTLLYINKVSNVDEDIDYKMYQYICKILKEKGYVHYEISNFAKEGYQSKHNLRYWNNKEYYGYGLGAAGYVNGIRYENTRSMNKYLKGNILLKKCKVGVKENKENEYILGFRKIDGINKENFYIRYNERIEKKKIIRKLIDENKLVENGTNIYVNEKYLYLLNSILVELLEEV